MAKEILAADMPDAMAVMAQRLDDAPLDDTLAECAEKLKDGFADNFQRKQDSEGATWPKRKDKSPNVPTHPLLQLSHALENSTQTDKRSIDGRELQVGVDPVSGLGGVPGAAVHQFGYPPRNIAQREYIYATDGVLDECGEIIGDGVIEEVFS